MTILHLQVVGGVTRGSDDSVVGDSGVNDHFNFSKGSGGG